MGNAKKAADFMNVRVLEAGAQSTYALIFVKNEEFIAGLTSWAKKNKLRGSHFTAIGAFREVTLGYFDRNEKAYKKIPLRDKWKRSRLSATSRSPMEILKSTLTWWSEKPTAVRTAAISLRHTSGQRWKSFSPNRQNICAVNTIRKPGSR